MEGAWPRGPSGPHLSPSDPTSDVTWLCWLALGKHKENVLVTSLLTPGLRAL